jgi:sn-glycerol 3-phosphate transport system ATP-binding protein
MNLLRIDQGRIAGSNIAVAGLGSHLGIRPEAVSIGGTVAAHVHSVEYLGADLVLRCAVGTEMITVRTDDHGDIAVGAPIFLSWPPTAEHYFGNDGQRMA